MIKLLFALVVLVMVCYIGYGAYRLASRLYYKMVLSRSPREKAILDKRDAEKRRGEALRMKARLQADDPYQTRLDTLIKIAERDIEEANRTIRDRDIQALEEREVED